MRARIEWMDTLRGTAIILVILNHSIYNAQEAYDSAPGWLTLLNDLLSPVRMPAMVFLSGLLLAGSLDKSAGRYVSGKLRAIAWPFLVWTVIGYAYEIAAGYVADGSPRFPSPLDVLINPLGHLWFLQYIFVFYMLALALKRVPPLVPAAAAIVVGLFVDGDALRFVTLFACFMVGAWFSTRMAGFDKVTHSRLALWSATGVVAVLVVLALSGVDMRGVVRYEVFSLPFVAAAVILTARAAMAVADRRWVAPLRYVGRNSLVFYLVHGYPVIAGVALGMRLTGNGLAAIVCGFIGGLVTAWVGAVLQARFRTFRLLFVFPAAARKHAPVQTR